MQTYVDAKDGRPCAIIFTENGYASIRLGNGCEVRHQVPISRLRTPEQHDAWRAANPTPVKSWSLPKPRVVSDAVKAERRNRKEQLAQRREVIAAGNCASCSRQELVDRLLNSGEYFLRLDATEEGLERAQAEYIGWTGGSFPEDLINLESERPQPRRWRFEFVDAPGSAYPFPVIVAGSQEVPYARLLEGARGLLHDNGRIAMHYAEEVERLVRLGLRAK